MLAALLLAAAAAAQEPPPGVREEVRVHLVRVPVIALDRQERGQVGERSAVQEVAAEFGVPVVAVAGLDELLALADERPELNAHKAALLAYRARYGAAARSQESPP